jgi:CBS domain-containing protein
VLVKDVMQTHPVTATPETRLPGLVRLLQRRGFRHVPVVDGGKLVGMVSIGDVVKAQRDQYQGEVDTLQTIVMGGA